ncbi:MAG: hypothetical protein WAV95_15975 [Azonexus sp.]
MSAHHKAPRAALGGRTPQVCGITPGSTDHRILLGLRGPGGMRSEQVYARWPHASTALYRLKTAGLIDMPDHGQKGQQISLTSRGREITEANGPLSRSKTLITYCQL